MAALSQLKANLAEPILMRTTAVGPSRSSEGFKLYYLVRWLDDA